MRKRKGKRKHGEFSKLDFTPCVLWAFFLSLSLSSLTLTHSQNFLCQHIRQQQSSLSLFLSSSSVCSTHTFLSLSHFGSVHNVDQSLCVSGSLKGESAAHAKPRFKTSSIPILVFFIWRNKKEVQKRADEEEKRIRKIETCLADWLTDSSPTRSFLSSFPEKRSQTTRIRRKWRRRRRRRRRRQRRNERGREGCFLFRKWQNSTGNVGRPSDRRCEGGVGGGWKVARASEQLDESPDTGEALQVAFFGELAGQSNKPSYKCKASGRMVPTRPLLEKSHLPSVKIWKEIFFKPPKIAWSELFKDHNSMNSTLERNTFSMGGHQDVVLL